MTGWDVFTGRAAVPAGMLAEVAALRAVLPGYDVILTSHSPAYRSGAIRRDPGLGIWCLISTDPASLWQEAAGRAPPAPDSNRQTACRVPPAPPSALAPADRIPPLDSAKARHTAK